jgi:twitching motility protein PilT
MSRQQIRSKRRSAQLRKQTERRRARRFARTVAVEVRGAGETYSAQTIDVSHTGVLLWITDERFAGPELFLNFVRYGERAAEEFAGGISLRFEKTEAIVQAELVRVRRLGRHNDEVLGLACHFGAPLPDEVVELLELGPLQEEPVRGIVPVPMPEMSPLPREEPQAPPPPESNGDGNETAEPVELKDRRTAVREETSQPVRVKGKHRTFVGRAINFSAKGMLLSLEGEDFDLDCGADNLVGLLETLGKEFGDGLHIRMQEAGFQVEGEVARVNERKVEGRSRIVIGCRFTRILTHEECEKLRTEAPAPVKAPSAPQIVLADLPMGDATVHELMAKAVEAKATDLHIKEGVPPRMRVLGSLFDVGSQALSREEAHQMALDLMTNGQAANFEIEGDVELTCALEGIGRYRVNVLRQRGATSLAIRCIPDQTPTIESLRLSPLARVLAERPRGLVLVTGPTGSGKSTTLAALINHINRTRPCHILTMEDPIEFVHEDVCSHITQREIGRDAVDFASALKRALRQDPDVIMVGEMRDLETISLALTAAETGHLVFGTLHTSSAALTPSRIIDVFPAERQSQIRQQLADSLQGIMAQILVPRVDEGLALAQEVLVATDAVRSMIRESKSPQIANLMQTGGRDGMQTLENALNELVAQGAISYQAAASMANVPKLVRNPEGER